MARVYKAVVYVIDYNDEIQDEDRLVQLIDEANTLHWVITKVSDVQKSKKFEFHDDLAINEMYPEVEEFEKYLIN